MSNALLGDHFSEQHILDNFSAVKWGSVKISLGNGFTSKTVYSNSTSTYLGAMIQDTALNEPRSGLFLCRISTVNVFYTLTANSSSYSSSGYLKFYILMDSMSGPNIQNIEYGVFGFSTYIGNVGNTLSGIFDFSPNYFYWTNLGEYGFPSCKLYLQSMMNDSFGTLPEGISVRLDDVSFTLTFYRWRFMY